MSDLWKRLDECRRQKGISLKEMGELCGISPQGVQKWKHGARIHVEHVSALAGYFGVSVDALLGKTALSPAPAARPVRPELARIGHLGELLDLTATCWSQLDEGERALVEAFHKHGSITINVNAMSTAVYAAKLFLDFGGEMPKAGGK